MTQRIRKAVFPAAGFGTRFLPVTKAQPKEMLPIVDKPVIQYLVEEAVASGIEEIIIITGRGKRAIEDHFDYSFELEHTLVEKNKNELLETVRKVSNLAKFIYVRQKQPLGDGHAILCAKELLGDEPFAVMFGDDIVDNETPALKQLMNVYEETGSPVIGLTQVPKDQTQSYGVVAPKISNGRTHELKGLVEKPKPEDAPSNLAIIGKYIVTPQALKALENAKPSPDGEIRLIDGFREFIKTDKIFGYELEGKRYDTGNKFGLIQATIDFALKRDGLDKQVRQYLKSLDLS